MMRPVDVDDPTTWPTRVLTVAKEWAEDCKNTTEYTSDLPLPVELEAPFRELLTGELLRAYHYTRLLPHERAMVLNTGLRALSAELLFDRIEGACSAGAISATEAAEFHKGHVFATNEQLHREDQVCCVLSKRVFERDPHACRPLLTTWGGEGMYMSSGARSFQDRLTTLGSPAVVAALLELGGAGSPHRVFPALHKVFVASVLGLEDVGADVFYRTPVPPENIECILPV
jgi:hypothetical protein